jgi:ribonucleoside-diphosphate reductase alpha chain
MRKHADAAQQVRTLEEFDTDILEAAKAEWAACLEIGAANGWRNAQASVLARLKSRAIRNLGTAFVVASLYW